MKRCVNNNFSFEGFWRQWHATLNKWIIRYMCSSPHLQSQLTV
jgi:D-alanyl-lipoteichoic acid acyltransferase DltB (MBOAT superfamily)